MIEFVAFVPKADLDAASNMREFVRFCRTDLAVFGADLDFDAPTWDVTPYYAVRGVSHRLLVNFTRPGPNNRIVGPPMPEPFSSQVKAWIRYSAARNGNRHPPRKEIIAMRVLLDAIEDRGLLPDMGVVDSSVLDHAVSMASRTASDHAAVVGGYLKTLSAFLKDKRLAPHAPADWVHGRGWNKNELGRIGRAADEARAAKLPSQRALACLPRAFAQATESRDVISTSVMALLLCAPSRVNEVFALPADCIIAPLSKDESATMLRWTGSKGYRDDAKAIPVVMADVAKDAVRRIREHTEEARAIAAWYEAHPTSLYLQPGREGMRGLDLTADEASDILGLDSADVWRRLAISQGIAVSSRRPQRGKPPANLYRFADVEDLVLRHLPPGFPILDRVTGLRYSQALVVARRNEFSTRGNSPWRCMIAPVTYQHIADQFHGKGHSEGRSVFLRLGLCTENDPVILRTHQLRHYLNTLAHSEGLSEFEIAAWSGRKAVAQNRHYDNRSPNEIVDRIRARDRGRSDTTALSINPPVSHSDITVSDLHGHATEYGYCEHDFAAGPCVMFMDCLHCTKHACVKGNDPRHRDRVSRSLDEAMRHLAFAEAAAESGDYGASDFVEAHSMTVSRLRDLLAILDDDGVPDGSVVRLSKSGRLTLVEQALADFDGDGIRLLSEPSDHQIATIEDAGR